MPQQILYVGSLDLAPDEFLWAAGLAAAHREAHIRGGAVTLIDHSEIAVPDSQDVWTLALSLPPYCSEAMAALAQAELDAENVHSPDLLECRTVLTLKGGEREVRLDAREFRHHHPRFAPETLVVGIVCADKLTVVRHEWGADGFESFQMGRQSAAASSGENYNPYRIWTDEELACAAQTAKERQSEYGVVECRFFARRPDSHE